MTQFSDLGLAEPLLRALNEEGYATPTPIQARAIPALLEGRDMLGIAQTGTGKTAAFALPILNRLLNNPARPVPRTVRALIMAPTRELAAQIGESFRAYGRFTRLSVAVIFGGVPHGAQIRALSRGVDILVATPGRLLDHIESGHCRLDHTEVVVLDEADHMLDLGFVVPIRKIVSRLASRRQSLFFSATMPKEIATLAGEMLREPVKVEVTPVATTAERVTQQVYLIEAGGKRGLLLELLSKQEVVRPIVFTRTKRGADRVAEHLEAYGLSAAAIHGNKSQGQRERALDGFKAGTVKVLVATDIAARGIDIDGISHVVNFELPNVPEQYVHRIGRTARAGNDGIAISFCDRDEVAYLRDIEKVTRQKLPVIDRRADPSAPAEAAPAKAQPRRPQGSQNRRPQGGPGEGRKPQGQRPQGQPQKARGQGPSGGGDRRRARG
ncbi:DEAD/DEAH box helicase [Zavarzinia compransoris]|uniref:DEAD-box ATP-dependent RNA helicase RhpA n=1 Tax=Zavarzinia compransoris TaxID=1264899 RepID=A0A317EF89_9PROT|nr:DEAD/DEAH box helicase [Zavarzinia compransoris]PWR24053.1 RNA helicase [Zavarzinia compransoris]TDP46408.1 ATP-dependent RNA helicase RhlE [Zavarzinia compransoris]